MPYTIQQYKVNPTVDSNGNPTVTIDPDGLLPALQTTYDSGLISLKVVDFDYFSLTNEKIILLCKEYTWNSVLSLWQPYVSGKFTDGRFVADNSTLVDPNIGIEIDQFYTSETVANPNYDNTQPIDPISNPETITEQVLKPGYPTPDLTTFIPQFLFLRNSALGQGIFQMIWGELSRTARN